MPIKTIKMLLRKLLVLICIVTFCQGVRAQDCPPILDEIDPFDSLRTVSVASFPIGNMLFTKVETIDGPTLAPEGEIMLMHTETDSLQLLFLHLELPEYNYVRTDRGYRVKFLMASDTIIGFYTVSDMGNFSKETNMRHYQHTALVPMDLYYQLTHDLVRIVRVEYINHRRTIALTAAQQQQLREAFRCLGERLGYYPIKP